MKWRMLQHSCKFSVCASVRERERESPLLKHRAPVCILRQLPMNFCLQWHTHTRFDLGLVLLPPWRKGSVNLAEADRNLEQHFWDNCEVQNGVWFIGIVCGSWPVFADTEKRRVGRTLTSSAHSETTRGESPNTRPSPWPNLEVPPDRPTDRRFTNRCAAVRTMSLLKLKLLNKTNRCFTVVLPADCNETWSFLLHSEAGRPHHWTSPSTQFTWAQNRSI